MCLLDNLIRKTAELGGSDLHISCDTVPYIRSAGKMIPLSSEALDAETVYSFLSLVLSANQHSTLRERGDVDASYSVGTIRCRINVYRDAMGVSFAVRIIKDEIPSMKELLLPVGLRRLINEEHGFIIITGPTGSGKTTTLASMIEAINQEQQKHIVTIEDPIEYKFSSAKAVIHQREVGRDCDSFYSGLRAALREDPDVILVGEMRDAETISTALAAAETGHLVFSTLHTGNIVESIDRLLQYFPSTSHHTILSQFANCFLGVAAQKLLPKTGGGRVAAFELMLRTDSTKNLIRTGAMHQIEDYLRPEQGMLKMDSSIEMLRNLRKIA